MESPTVDAVEFRDGQRQQWNKGSEGGRRHGTFSNLVLLAVGRA
jgi:hypothetical protein